MKNKALKRQLTQKRSKKLQVGVKLSAQSVTVRHTLTSNCRSAEGIPLLFKDGPGEILYIYAIPSHLQSEKYTVMHFSLIELLECKI